MPIDPPDRPLADHVCSVGRRGYSYDLSLAESFKCPLKSELLRNKGPQMSPRQSRPPNVQWVDTFNEHQLCKAHGRVPLSELTAT
jgi:hypothetical protein